jgi:hypothetical protein
MPQGESTPPMQDIADPFRYPLVGAGFVANGVLQRDIKTFTEDPSYIIRPWSKYPSNPDERMKSISDAQAFNNLLVELGNNYGIENSGVSYVTSRDPDNANGEIQYLVTHRIRGEDMAEGMSNVPEEVTVATVGALIDYWTHVVEHGGTYMHDLDLHQFVYGRRGTDTTDKPYLVDLERSMISTYDPSNPDDENWSLANRIYHLLDDVNKMERVYGHSFDAYRERLSGLKDHWESTG